MKPVVKRSFILIVIMMLVLSFPQAIFAEGNEAVIPVSVNGSATLKITPDGNAPIVSPDEINISGSGEVKIPVSGAGEFRYRVRQLAGEDENTIYDDSEWLVQVFSEEQQGQYVIAVVTSKDGSNYKPGEISFANKTEDSKENDEETRDDESGEDPEGFEPVIVDPPVKKVVKGDPKSKESFTFIMSAVDNTAGYKKADMPMPDGSEGGIKKKTVQGAGKYEFGEFELTKPGTYRYKITEEKGSAEGWTYDDTVYSITWIVTEDDGQLQAKISIENQKEEKSNTCLFVNSYKEGKSGGILSNIKTGDSSTLALYGILLAASLLALIYITLFKRKTRNEK